MLALIRTLGPVVALVIGLAGGGTIIGGLAYVYNIVIDNPAIAREATARANDACTIRVQDAARKAEIAERTRQQEAIKRSLDAYQEIVDAQQALADQLRDANAQQEADYEAKLKVEGKSCPLDAEDINYIKGGPPPQSKGK